MNKALLVILLMSVGHAFCWFQGHLQLKWVWFKDHPFLMALLGVPISYLFIYAIQIGYQQFDKAWPLKLISFGAGTIVFAILTYFVLHEPMTTKTGVSLLLASLIVFIQIFF